MHDGTHYCSKMFFATHFICIIVYMYYLRFCYIVVLKLQLVNGNTHYYCCVLGATIKEKGH